MNEELRDDRCIERRVWIDGPLSNYVRYYSVAEYEKALSWGRTLSSSRARAFHEVVWTEDAPAVESLSTGWRKTSQGYFRIRDWDVYDRQMRKLIGIA